MSDAPGPQNQRPPYDEPGPERRTTMDLDRRVNATMDLVTTAAHTAAMKVIDQRQAKTVIYSVLGALLVSLAVALPVTLYVGAENRRAATENARFNCGQWNEGADTLAKYIESTAKLQRDQGTLVAKRQDVLLGLSKIFGEGTYQELQRKTAQLNARAFIYWTDELIPKLRAIAAVNCAATITQGGVRTTAKPTKG